MKRLNILFTLTPAFNPNDGGVQRTTYKLGKRFSEEGHLVTYFSLKNIGNTNAIYGKLYHVNEANGLDNVKNEKYFKNILRELKPDIVINQMPYEVKLSSILFHEKSKLKYVLLGCLRNSLFSVKNNIRDVSKRQLPNFLFPFFDNPKGLSILLRAHRLKHKRQLRRILDIHDYYILLAPPNQRELEYFVGNYQKEKIFSIPNSIPEVFYSKTKKEKIILHVGRLNIPQKRSDLLAEFWKNVHESLPEWKFVIVGDGPYKENLIREIEEKKLPRIFLEGYQKPEPYYEKATFFMMPSAYEGFPNTILEAQSYGCIPLAFDSYAALSWIVNDEKDSLLIDAFDTSKMAKELIEVLNDENKVKTMREASLTNASRFTIDKVGDIWLNFFKKILNK